MTMDTHAMLSTKDFEIARKFWMDRLADLPPELELPNVDRDLQADGFLREAFSLGPVQSKKLLSLGKNQDVLLLVVLLAILKIVLRKYSRQDDSIVSAPIYSTAGGHYRYNKLLPFRDRLNAGVSFKSWLVEVKRTVIGSYKHQHYSIDNVLTALGHGRRKQSLHQILIQLENIHEDAISIHQTPDSGFQCGFSFSKQDDGIFGDIVFSRNYFDRTIIRGLAGHFLEVTRQVLDDLDRPLDTVELMSPAEKQELLSTCNHDSSGEIFPDTVWDLFKRRVESDPDNIACVCDGESLTYRQLSLRSLEMATRLVHDFGLAPSDRAAVLCQRSLDVIVAFWGIIGAGCCYVPLDPSFPKARIGAILKDAAVNVVVCQEGARGLPGHEYPLLVIDEVGEKKQGCITESQPSPDPLDPVYIIYTSGSTGRPKGVLIQHRNLGNFVGWRIRALGYTQEDTSLQMLSPAFDAFGSNLYPALCSGGSVVMLSRDLLADYDRIRSEILRYRVTNLSVLPSMYRLLMDGAGPGDLKTLRFVVLGGEVVDAGMISMSNQQFPHISLVNEYGPTESCIATSACLEIKDSGIRNIGRPVANNRVYILDVDGCLLPSGVPGELCVSGQSVGCGYLNDMLLTKEKFVPDPFSNDGSRMYRTGDKAKYLDGGTIEFIGRIDQQVKIRGYRVEPSEIESLLLESQLVDSAVVTVATDPTGGCFLCAYFTPGPDGVEEKELKRYLEGLCPAYMIPAYFVPLDSFPLTTNGKLDRNALPEPMSLKKGRRVKPRNRQEELLAQIWSELLGIAVEEIGVFDNFFDLGGHSLKVTMLISKILGRFRVKIPLGVIFEQPFIWAISQIIDRASQTGVQDIHPTEKKEYYPQSSAQKRLYFLDQFEEIVTSYNMPFAVRIKGMLDSSKLEAVFDSMVKRHETLRTAFLTVDSQPVQRVLPSVAFSIQVIDLTGADCSPGIEDAVQRAVQEFITPFQLDLPPLMRLALITIAPEDAILLFDIHHIICDGTSGAILGNDFMRLYRGDCLEPLRIQYKDYACWQQWMFDSGEIASQEKYWLGVYDSRRRIPTLRLPLDFPRGETVSYQGDRYQFELQRDQFKAFQEVGRRFNVTLYMNLLAVFNVLLHKYTSDEDIIVGCAVAGRSHEDLQKIMGMFINILPMRNFPTGNKSYASFLEEVGNHVVQAFENQDFPFERLIGHLKPRLDNDPSRHPLYVVDFTLQNFGQADEHDLEVSVVPYQMENKTSKLDINLMAYERKDHIRFSLEYCSGLFRPRTIEKMADHLIRIIRAVSANPQILLKDLQLLEEQEKVKVTQTLKKNKSLLAQLAGEDFDE